MQSDPISQHLIADGYLLEPRRLNPQNPDSAFLGWHFTRKNAEYIFRALEGTTDTLIIPYYGMIDPQKRQTLGSGFTGLLWFAHYVRDADCGIRFLTACIHHDPAKYPWSLSHERMKAYYLRMGCRIERRDIQYDWVIYPVVGVK